MEKPTPEAVTMLDAANRLEVVVFQMEHGIREGKHREDLRAVEAQLKAAAAGAPAPIRPMYLDGCDYLAATQPA